MQAIRIEQKEMQTVDNKTTTTVRTNGEIVPASLKEEGKRKGPKAYVTKLEAHG